MLSVSGVYKLPNPPLNVCFFKVSLVDGESHFADYIVAVVARKMARDDRINAIQEAAEWKAQGSS